MGSMGSYGDVTQVVRADRSFMDKGAMMVNLGNFAHTYFCILKTVHALTFEQTLICRDLLSTLTYYTLYLIYCSLVSTVLVGHYFGNDSINFLN